MLRYRTNIHHNINNNKTQNTFNNTQSTTKIKTNLKHFSILHSNHNNHNNHDAILKPSHRYYTTDSSSSSSNTASDTKQLDEENANSIFGSEKWKTTVIRMYRSLLKVHERKLPAAMRQLGDSYVKDEFRRHQEAGKEYAVPFIIKWAEYYNTLAGEKTYQTIGRDLPEDLLNDDQKEQLELLRKEAERVRNQDS